MRHILFFLRVSEKILWITRLYRHDGISTPTTSCRVNSRKFALVSFRANPEERREEDVEAGFRVFLARATLPSYSRADTFVSDHRIISRREPKRLSSYAVKSTFTIGRVRLRFQRGTLTLSTPSVVVLNKPALVVTRIAREN